MASTTNSKRFGKVAVLMGGTSTERESSLKSGSAILKALHDANIDAHLIDIRDYPITQLRSDKFDCAFNIIHGKVGEDGELQSLLQHLQIPYTGSGVLASAIGMDKWRCKMLWRGFGLPVASAVCLQSNQLINWNGTTLTSKSIPLDIREQIDSIGYPVFVKPNCSGSSLGASCVKSPDDLVQALEFAFKEDSTILIEKFLRGREFTVGILDDQVLAAIEVKSDAEFFDINAKANYNNREIHPSNLESEVEAQLHRLVLDAWKAVGGRGWGRIDVIADDKLEKFWLLEVNTTPGMTPNSLYPLMAKMAGYSIEELVVKILELTDKST